MDRELSSSTNSNMADTVSSDGVSFFAKNNKISVTVGFLVASLLLHGLLLSFFKFPQRARFENTASPLSVILQNSDVEKKPSPSQSVSRARAKPLPDTARTPPLSASEIWQQSEQAIEQQLRLEKQQLHRYQFGESLNDERSTTPPWLTPGNSEERREFRVEEFPLADGGTFVKLVYANGKTLCFDVRDADPFDPFSFGIWRFSRCRG